MWDDLWRLFRPRRSASSREQAVGLVLLILFILAAVPLLDCPCGGSPRIGVVSAPSDDVAYLGMIRCPSCRDSGRRSLADCLLREPPALRREFPNSE